MSEIDQIKDRWIVPAGQRLVAAVLQPKVTPEEYRQACADFFGTSSSSIKSPVFRGMGDFEDLRGINLSGRDLRGLVFAKGDISHGNFDNCLLDDTNFFGAKLYHTSFKNTKALQRAQFVATYAQHIDFENSHFFDSLFFNSDLRYANFKNAVLDHCDFSTANLQGANLEGARFIECEAQRLFLSERHQHEPWFKESTFVKTDIVWLPDETAQA